MTYQNIPQEMRVFNQWVLWRMEDLEAKKPTKVPYCAKNGKLASVTNPDTWASFDDALDTLLSSNGQYSGLGFVLTEADPYGFIDLDDTKNDPVLVEHQMKVFKEFDSFSERSPSGTGLHIIVKGSLPNGRKRASVEVYTNLRYMTMTGDIFHNVEIKDKNELLNGLWQQMGQGRKSEMFYAGLEQAKLTDEEVLQIAQRAANAEKFCDLYYLGDWQKYYPSQSEADFAIFDILAFYSENGAQTQRLFLKSKLAEREKSRAQYRLNYMLNRCFDRMLPPVDIDHLKNQINEILEKKKKEESERVLSLSLSNESAISNAKTLDSEMIPTKDIYSVPPGLVGEIAKFIYSAAPRPVPEISLAGALGLIAGIVGRAYNISGTGLNQYILLLAPTGTGKEAIASGIDKIFAAVLKTVPSASDFIGPSEIASSQAIIKYMSRGPNSFVSLVGEFGIYLQQMASTNAPPHLLGLRRFLLDAYNKSGEGKVLRPSIYSDKANNTSAVNSPAFTILGESTPEKFYEGLHEGLISEGLLPRFTTIEYQGQRPPLNEYHQSAQPCFNMIDRIATLCAHALMLNSQDKAISVTCSPEAEKYFKQFDKHCDLQINGSDREIRRHLWNRAHIKALKLGALIAVGVNPYDPQIDINIATWATEIIVSDVRNLLEKFNSGEIGIDNDETKQLSKVIATFREFILMPWKDAEKYAGSALASLHSDKVTPYAFIQRKLAAVSIFRKDRQGSSAAIKRAINTLIERGDIQEMTRGQLMKDYNTSAKAFAVTNLKVFDL